MLRMSLHILPLKPLLSQEIPGGGPPVKFAEFIMTRKLRVCAVRWICNYSTQQGVLGLLGIIPWAEILHLVIHAH